MGKVIDYFKQVVRSFERTFFDFDFLIQGIDTKLFKTYPVKSSFVFYRCSIGG